MITNINRTVVEPCADAGRDETTRWLEKCENAAIRWASSQAVARGELEYLSTENGGCWRRLVRFPASNSRGPRDDHCQFVRVASPAASSGILMRRPDTLVQFSIDGDGRASAFSWTSTI